MGGHVGLLTSAIYALTVHYRSPTREVDREDEGDEYNDGAETLPHRRTNEGQAIELLGSRAIDGPVINSCSHQTGELSRH